MKLGKLTIKNIASIENAVIDFSDPNWCDEPLFLIHGETGSGKSTILDCICLALFKQTPRMANSSKAKYFDEVFRDDFTSNSVLQYVRKNVSNNADIYSELEFYDDNNNQYVARLEFLLTRNNTFKGTGYAWTLKKNAVYIKDVKETIVQAIGLDFDQFCRTTMLAQGEFTKFLKANESDKTAILRKITNTEIFYTIGCRICERVKEEEEKLKSMQDQLIGMTTNQLTNDQIAQMEVEIATLQADNANRAVLLSIFTKQNEWLEKDADNKRALLSATAALESAQKAMDDPQIKTDKQLIVDWKATIEARQNLATIQVNSPKLENIQQAIKQLQDSLPALQGDENQKKQSAVDADKQQKELYETFKQLDAKSLTDEKDLLAQCIVVQDHYTKAENAKKEKEEADKEVPNYEPIVKQARQDKEEAEKTYNSNARTVEKFTKLLRSELKVGGNCPVCGQKVTSIVHDEDFEKLLTPLKAKMDAAKDAFDKAQEQFSKLQAIASAKNKTWEQLQKEYGTELTKLQAIETRTGLDSKDFANIDAATRIEEIGKELAKISDVKKQYEAALANYQKAQNLANEAQKKRENTENKIKENEASRGTLEPMVNKAKSELNTFIANSNYTEQQIASFAQYSADNIKRKEESIQQKIATFNRAEGAHKAAVTADSEHTLLKPVIAATDTQKSVEQRILDLNATIHKASIDISNKQILIDKAQQEAAAIQKLTLSIGKQANEVHEWAELKAEFSPSQDGFSRKAQNYILDDLMHRANEHLSRFCPRYELSSQDDKFAILVKDCLSGGAVRSAEMLSGGESFLVSLSLALALAKLGDLSSCVDVLFIDEGFDTLDEKTLGQVIDTLTKLHSDTKRRIGLISHVALLRESIPMHISVTRKAGQEGISEVSINQTV